MKAYNIDWDVDIEEALEQLDEMDYKKAASVIGVSADQYANMTTEERHDFAYDLFHHCPSELDDFMGLPSEVKIPENIIKEIEEWHPYYGRCETCKYYSNCNACSNCNEGSEYDFDLKHINDQYITDWLSDEYGFCIKGYKLDTDTES